MNLGDMFRGLSISASALSAERLRMGIIATNIAHAQDVDRGDGTPYRRKEAVFGAILGGELEGGVQVLDVAEDNRTPMVRIKNLGHPMADKDGMVTMPNVNPAYEMVDLITATRSYEANIKAMRSAVELAERAFELGR